MGLRRRRKTIETTERIDELEQQEDGKWKIIAVTNKMRNNKNVDKKSGKITITHPRMVRDESARAEKSGGGGNGFGGNFGEPLPGCDPAIVAFLESMKKQAGNK